MTEVQQTLMNYSTNNDRANNMNICPDHPENHPWPRTNKRNQDNQSSTSSDAKSIGHWDNKWAEQKCFACGNHWPHLMELHEKAKRRTLLQQMQKDHTL